MSQAASPKSARLLIRSSPIEADWQGRACRAHALVNCLAALDMQSLATGLPRDATELKGLGDARKGLSRGDLSQRVEELIQAALRYLECHVRASKALSDRDRDTLQDLLEHTSKELETLFRETRSTGRWTHTTEAELNSFVEKFFRLCSEHSGGRFKVFHSGSTAPENGYLVLLEVEGAGPEGLLLPPTLFADLRNLLANARKYSPPGTVIRAVLRATASGLEIRVADQGQGIPAADLAKVVAFGNRGGESHHLTHGIGAGLTAVVHNCTSLGGEVEIESTAGRGTTVTLRLPLPALTNPD